MFDVGRSFRSSKDLASCQLDSHLRCLAADACRYDAGDPKRQLVFGEIVHLVMQSRRLWRESSPYYPDALQEMWEYCFLKLDDPDDGYNPDVCRVTTWLDDRLKKILRRYRDRTRRQLTRQIFAIRFDDGRLLDPVDSLVAPPDPQSALDIWAHLLDWVLEDPGQRLRSRVCSRYPKINAQVLLLRRLPPNEQSWDQIAAEFMADKTYIAQWYSRYCNALLRDWGRLQGYLD